jgi:thioredoxin-like negative regulator of GroEL
VPDPGKQWQPSTPGVSADVFADVIEGSATVIHFWAPWNPYDRELDKNLQAVKGEFEKRIRFYSVNTDETAYSEIVERYHVAALPALLCFVNGKVRGRFHGVETVEALRTFLEEMGAEGGR